MESDSIFNLVDSCKKQTIPDTESQPKSQTKVTDSQLKPDSQTASTQAIYSGASALSDSQSTYGDSQSNLISRLQRRYKRGIELASQPITQLAAVTQNTQLIQQQRYSEVQQAARHIVSEQDLSNLCPDMDTGFYGLPDKVKKALSELRGITKLYGESQICHRFSGLRGLV